MLVLLLVNFSSWVKFYKYCCDTGTTTSGRYNSNKKIKKERTSISCFASNLGGKCHRLKFFFPPFPTRAAVNCCKNWKQVVWPLPLKMFRSSNMVPIIKLQTRILITSSFKSYHNLIYSDSVTLRALLSSTFLQTARFSDTTEGALFISAQLSSDAICTLWKVWVLIWL